MTGGESGANGSPIRHPPRMRGSGDQRGFGRPGEESRRFDVKLYGDARPRLSPSGDRSGESAHVAFDAAEPAAGAGYMVENKFCNGASGQALAAHEAVTPARR